ncbi:hypothetical protein [Emticicia sp.]
MNRKYQFANMAVHASYQKKIDNLDLPLLPIAIIYLEKLFTLVKIIW